MDHMDVNLIIYKYLFSLYTTDVQRRFVLYRKRVRRHRTILGGVCPAHLVRDRLPAWISEFWSSSTSPEQKSSKYDD
jgi:hypothetical protein